MSGIIFTTILIAIISAVVFFKYKKAMNTPADQRTSIEKILSSIAVSNKKNLEEISEAMRTPEITRTEGIQRCKEELRNLETTYKDELFSLIRQRENNSKKIEEYEKKPKEYEIKAKEYKEKMIEAENRGEKTLAEQYKQNAIMLLDLKKKSEERIVKLHNFLKDLNSAIDLSKVQYERNKLMLEEMLLEFESMQGKVNMVKFNNCMNTLKSLKNETSEKITEQNAKIETEEYFNQEDMSKINTSEFEEEFNKL